MGVVLCNSEDSEDIVEKLPSTFRHTVLVAEFRLQGRLHGFPWGRGSSRRILPRTPLSGRDRHLNGEPCRFSYIQVQGLRSVVFATTGNVERGKAFLTPIQVEKRLLACWYGSKIYQSCSVNWGGV